MYHEKLTEQFPIRKTAAQKEAFRRWFIQEAKSLGYRVQVEENGRFVKHRNVIVGNPEKAAVVFSAHYDTPARHLLPSLIIPRNPVLFYLWQLLNVALLLVATLAVTVLLGQVIKTPGAVLWIFVGCYFALLMLLNYGPANRRNANRSTSGVAAVMELMALLPEEVRGKVAFILFDDSEKGKQGSAAYGKTHLQVQCVKTVVALDCLGVGQDVLVLPRKMARMRPEYTRLCKALGEERVHVLEGGLTTYAGDHDCFQCGVAILCCRRGPLTGWYVPWLNTGRDTACDRENILFIAQRLAEFAKTL